MRLCWRICLSPRKNKEAEPGVLCWPLMCMQLGCIKFHCCKFLVWPLPAALPPASLRQARKLQFELQGSTSSVLEPNRSSSTQSRQKSEFWLHLLAKLVFWSSAWLDTRGSWAQDSTAAGAFRWPGVSNLRPAAHS